MADKQKASKNFGQLKTVYNGVLAESISTGDKKRKGIFKDYIKALKENETFRRFIYQGRGKKVRDLFDQENLPRRERAIRNRIKSAGLWMR
ncbi:MAG: hypothetical protein ACO20S_08570 [Paracoccaceae bacterium]